MRKLALSTTIILATMSALLLNTGPATATSLQTWVASNGTNNATCSRTSPCDTFQNAHDATTAGGEINCVDAGDYGGVQIPRLTINRSITINCEDTLAGIFPPNTTGVFVAAGANDTVTLRGLDIDGLGGSCNGIYFQSGAALHVHNVHIRSCHANSPGNAGILFQPSAFAELYVADSYITDNGSGSQPATGGIVIQPLMSGSANVSINRVRLENNATGVWVDGTGTTGVAVNAVVLDSVMAGSVGNGIQAVSSSGNAAVSVFVDHCVISGNFGSGVNADGATASGQGSALARIGDSTIALNVTGASTTGSGVVQSFKNNRISSNLTDGTPIAAFPGPGGTPLQ